MKIITRMLAMLLVLVSLFSLFSMVAFAASSKTGTNVSATVLTGKRSWLVLNPQIRVENYGSNSMFVTVEDTRGAVLKHVVLASGEKIVFTLKPNTEYVVRFSGNFLACASGARGCVSAVRNIREIY